MTDTDSEELGTTNPLPADAVILPADARGTFHLPPRPPIGGSEASPGRCPFCSSTATPRSLFIGVG